MLLNVVKTVRFLRRLGKKTVENAVCFLSRQVLEAKTCRYTAAPHFVTKRLKKVRRKLKLFSDLFILEMKSLGIDTPRSGICHTVEGAEKIAEEIGFPLVVRPAYTMGG